VIETTETRQPVASGTQHATEQIDQVIVRFAGDSGDGMQLTGDRFTTSSALLGNDLSTFPDFPAEIRAPAGTVNGVSAFQVHISDHDILTPGDSPNVLVAMNPAALKANIDMMAKGTVLIVNSDSFEERDLAKAGYGSNPLTDGSLAAYTVYEVPMTSITQEVCKEAGVKPRDAERSKNFFAPADQLALHEADRSHDRVDRRALRRQAPGGRRQHAGVPGRVRLRRDGRAVRVELRGEAGHLREG
jgi:Pyruvate/2-oxoacid:ferredoxin oxidoreductase gamma subunit